MAQTETLRYTGTRLEFQYKLGNEEFQKTINVSIEYIIDFEVHGPFTDDRITKMNRLSEDLPPELTSVKVIGKTKKEKYFAIYAVAEGRDEVIIQGTGGPVKTKPIIFF